MAITQFNQLAREINPRIRSLSSLNIWERDQLLEKVQRLQKLIHSHKELSKSADQVFEVEQWLKSNSYSWQQTISKDIRAVTSWLWNHKLAVSGYLASASLAVLSNFCGWQWHPKTFLSIATASGIRHYLQVREHQKIDRAINQMASMNLDSQAIQTVQRLLEENPQVKYPGWSDGWGSRKRQPINPIISVLAALYCEVCFPKFEKTLKKFKDNNPWSQPEVLSAADHLLKVGYLVTCLTLEDLPEFVNNVEQKTNEKRSFAKALTRQDSYLYRTFYYCTNAYHMIRGCWRWEKPGDQYEERLYPASKIPETYASPFYQPNTFQSEWRRLYNDCCDLVRSKVDEDQLRKADPRHVNWTIKDEKSDFFKPSPDTQPT